MGPAPEPERIGAGGITDTELPPGLRAGAVEAVGIAWPSIKMSWLQRLHFMRSVRPTTFSSGI